MARAAVRSGNSRGAVQVRYIGITGLPLCVFKRVLDAAPAGAVDCVLSYCHYNLLDTALASMLPYLQVRASLAHAAP